MSKTIREIKEELERASGDERRALYALYEQDKRTGVQKAFDILPEQELAKEQELLRPGGMCTYERNTGLMTGFVVSTRWEEGLLPAQW